jgi:hypothetical protein
VWSSQEAITLEGDHERAGIRPRVPSGKSVTLPFGDGVRKGVPYVPDTE